MIGFVRRWKKEILCVAAGIILYLIMEVISGNGGMKNITYLKRGSYGTGEITYRLTVEGLGDNQIPLDILLEDKVYTEEEADQVFNQIYEGICQYILNGNQSLSEVRENLNLVSGIPEYGVKIRWFSDSPEYLDTFGEVHPLPQGINQADVMLKMELSDGKHRKEFDVSVTVLPPVLSEEAAAAEALQNSIKKLDEEHRMEDGIWLPREYGGKTLYFKDQEESDYKVLLIMGCLLAGLSYAKEESDKKENLKKRKHQMLLDYSEIVSKLMVFFGAGMTVPIAWERVVKDYEESKERQKESVRHAYEEMSYSYYQMKSGVPETQIYREFGSRCRLQPYTKLASLLEQNRKNGMKNLRSLMELEMTDAFEQRKNTAKRLGEEASTKLLVPLFFMLAVVMVMIVMPAFLAFY